MSNLLQPALCIEHFEQMEKDHLEPFLDFCLQTLLKSGVDDYEMNYSCTHSYELASRLMTIEKLEFEEGFSLSVTLYKGAKKITFSSHGCFISKWQEQLQKALFFLERVDDDPCVGLQRGYDYTQVPSSFTEQFYPTTLSYTELSERLLHLESVGMNHQHIINSEGASLTLCYELEGKLNSKGLRYRQLHSYYQASVALIAQKGDLLQQVDSCYQGSLSDQLFSQLDPIGLSAQKRALDKLSQRSIESGSYPVIFSPRVSSSVFQCLFSALSGQSQYKKSSFLLGALGQSVLPSWMDLIHQPCLPGAHYSSLIDSDGLQAQEQTLIQSGGVENYILSLYSARRLGLEKNHLAGGVKNVFITSNAEHQQEIVSQFDKVIVIEDLMGTGVNLLNGDYSMGINGALYENQERLFALKEATVAGNLKTMLSQVAFHGADFLPYTNIRSGATAIEAMTVSCA